MHPYEKSFVKIYVYKPTIIIKNNKKQKNSINNKHCMLSLGAILNVLTIQVHFVKSLFFYIWHAALLHVRALGILVLQIF